MPKGRENQEPLLDLATRSLDEQPLAIGVVARSVMRLTADPEIGIWELARAVSADPGLSGKIIKMANSAFYAGPSIVTSIPEAIAKLGITATRSVAITASVQALFRHGGREGFERDLWLHSLVVGIGSRIIAQHSGSLLAEEAFLSGLLHDIAKLVLLQRFPQIYGPILRRTVENDEVSLDVELTCMGFTHADLGAMILERWAFGPVAVRAVRFHHDPDRTGSIPNKDHVQRDARQIAHAICLANVLGKYLQKASRNPCKMSIPNSPSREHFTFTNEQLNGIAEEISFRVGDELQVFGQPDTPMFVPKHRTSAGIT